MTIDFEALDNPIWHALTSRHQKFSLAHGMAARYEPDVAPFCGLSNYSPGALTDLSTVVGVGDTVALFTANALAIPNQWEVQRHRRIDQMICKHVPPQSAMSFIRLDANDVIDMLDLTAITHPGPFQPRTIELGSYFGLRSESGQLIAMAGQRLKLDGFTEISAVCTHPHHRKKGLSTALVSYLAKSIIETGKIPFLHVKYENDARQVYQRVGFEFRATLDLTVITRKY